MTAKDDGVYCHTEAMVSQKRRKHYRVPVRSQHWQLRSLISAEKRHLLYFPGGNGSNHVQRLNTVTHECETIKLLTFAPRCLVAQNGWLCCGSESGDFVAIRLDESSDGGNPNPLLGLNPDVSLSSNAESYREESLLALMTEARRSNKSLVARSVKFANDRVNCITLWFPNDITPAVQGAYTEPVAVLANNDRTVNVISLCGFDQDDKMTPIDVITYPDYVNRAIISPDGHMMVAILDDPYLYVHVRVEKSGGSEQSTDYEWVLRQRLMLKSQKKSDRTDSRGSFAACFSNSGLYLAVGTQHGTISIFDAQLLLDIDVQPLVTTFNSSRPRSGPGAIRDMAFCPGPYDVLAWTEDRGHIGVADVRANFVIRQIVDINAEDDFEHINILDRSTIDPLLLDNPRRERLQASARGGLAASRHGGEGRADSLNQPLTPSETMVLEAIQGDRRRRDGTAQRSEDSMLDSPWSYLASLRSAAANETAMFRQRGTSNNNGTSGSQSASQYRERAYGNVRQLSESGDRLYGRWDLRWIDRLDQTAAMRELRERDPDRPDYMNVLDILQARNESRLISAFAGAGSTGARTGSGTAGAGAGTGADAGAGGSGGGADAGASDAELLVPQVVDQAVSRWEESAIRGTLSDPAGVFEVPPSPDNTAGLAWSDDGRTLFVGAQNGIYEFQINAQNRLFYPSMEMR